MRMHGLKADRQAAQLVAERTEGNLLAADQEIRKLVLILGDSAVDEKAVIDAVADSARYSVFDFSAAVLAGDRHPGVQWQRFLQRCAALDVRVKRARGDAWEALLDLSLAVAGRPPSVRADSIA